MSEDKGKNVRKNCFISNIAFAFGIAQFKLLALIMYIFIKYFYDGCSQFVYLRRDWIVLCYTLSVAVTIQ